MLGEGGGTGPVGKDQGAPSTPSPPFLFSWENSPFIQGNLSKQLITGSKNRNVGGSHTTKNIVFNSGLETALNRHWAAPIGRNH